MVVIRQRRLKPFRPRKRPPWLALMERKGKNRVNERINQFLTLATMTSRAAVPIIWTWGLPSVALL
jgi:hypothetical protein